MRAASAGRDSARSLGQTGGESCRLEREGGERPHVTARAEEPNNALWPRGSRSLCRKRGALSDHQRLIRRRGVTPLMYQYGEMWSIVYDRSVSLGLAVAWSNVSHKLAVMRAWARCAPTFPSQKPHGGLPRSLFGAYFRAQLQALPTTSFVSARGFF